jgi:2-hydroxychromene-2-carboxylate isomerase
MPRQIDYYFSFQSPWAYVGHKAFRDLVSTYDLNVNHKPVVLVDLFSETGGVPLMKRHPVRQRYRMVELQRWRDKRGLKFHLQPANWPFNARLADGVAIAAIEAGFDPDRYLARGFAAVWEDQLNLADPATVAKLADESGLPGKQWWSDRSRKRSARPMSRTARMRWRVTCSARRPTCWTAKCSGDRTGSNCLKMR